MHPCYLVSLALIMSSALVAQTESPKDYSYEILYTARTLGYARIPDEQTLTSPATPSKPNETAHKLKEELDRFNDASKLQIRIGMGDNLAPDLLARTFKLDRPVPTCDGSGSSISASIHVPKSYFVYEPGPKGDPGHWKIWCDPQSSGFPSAEFYDNAAAFFVWARYNVVAPGKHDFYFGADYLRRVERYLDKNDVHMLAANLIVSTTVAPTPMNAHARIPERLEKDCHNFTVPGVCYHTDFGPASLDLPDNVLPWKRQFLLQNARRAFIHDPGHRAEMKFRSDELGSWAGSASDAEKLFKEDKAAICVAPPGSSDPAMALGPGHSCLPLIPADQACDGDRNHHQPALCQSIYSATKGVFDPKTNPATTDVTFVFKNDDDHLIAGRNHMFCVYPADTEKQFKDSLNPICQPFPVEMPFFGSNPECPPDEGATGCEVQVSLPSPYALIKRKDGELTVAVFSVVDPDLLSNVGLLNTSWLNDNAKWDTKVQVTAPDYALLQALDLCNSSKECRDAPKVLLAQMSYARASQLIATGDFGEIFDAVVTQASPEHDTGDVDIKFTGKTPRFVLSPPFSPQVYRATISKVALSKSTGKKPPSLWTLRNSVPPAPTQLRTHAPKSFCQGNEPTCQNLERISESWLSQQKSLGSVQPFPNTAPAASSPFQQAVLLAMRKRVKADIAMLQTRDLYNADNLSLEKIDCPGIQDQIDRILWKDDFLVVLHVTGATIRKLMAQSAAFDQQDKDSLSTEIEKGRRLVTLGLYHHPADPDVYYINGAVMSDTALYTIATTDFIIGGDTGYSMLASPDVPPAMRAGDFAGPNIAPIAGVVCSALSSSSPQSTSHCLDMKLTPNYFDTSRRKPFDATPGYTALRHYSSFGKFGWPKQFAEPRRPYSNVEQQTQQRRFWSLNLENLDFSESGLFINHIANTKMNLGGVSNPLLTFTGSSNIGADHKARLIFDYRQGTFYGLSDSAYLRNATTGSPLSLASNMIGFEGGGTLRIPTYLPLGVKHLFDLPQRPSWLSLQYSVRYERELTQPPDTPETVTAAPNPVLLPTPRVSTVYGRVGLRAELADMYLETGFEEINSRNLLQQYVITQGASTLYCNPGPATLLCGPNQNVASSLDQTPIATESSLASPFTAARTRRDPTVPGFYLNFFLKFPLLSRQDANRTDQSWYLTFTNKGDFYFNHGVQTAIDTRYLDKFTPALQIPIWGNIALTPKVDFILYEDKINRYHYRSIAPSISLSYTFNFRQGMLWPRALMYGTQTTAASPAGNTH